MADKKYIVDMFEEIVDNVRQTGTVTSASEVSGVYTIVSTNELHEGWHVTIDSIDYEISSVSSTGFTITAETGLTLTGESWKALEPFYDYGHPISIRNKLVAKDGHKTYKWQKYPLVILIQDISEEHTSEMGIDYTFPPRLVILGKTNKNYIEQERYTNVLKPVLYPIYEELIEQVQEYDLFYFPSYVAYEKIDRVYWGTSNIFGNEATGFNDYLDGIELLFDPINVKRQQQTSC